MSHNGNFSSALILASGEDVPRKRLEVDRDSTLIICADAGAHLARVWELKPHLIIGDLDSISADDRTFWEQQGVPFQTAPVRKDQTDVELAVEYALGLGVVFVTLVGAWGSRLDHALGNLELLYRLASQGIGNELITSRQILTAFRSNFAGKVREKSWVSLVPLTPVVRGVHTEGLGYPLRGEDLQKGTTRGISNYAVEQKIAVRIAEGVLLLIREQ